MENFITVIIFLLVLQIFLLNVESYDLKCPSQTSWKIRAKVKCNSTLKYFCLYNNVEEKYVEGCKGPDWDRKGSKRIFSGSFTRETCKHKRFQPFYFQTNESMSDCIYAKSLCNEKGQIIYKDDSTKDDRTCRCDYEESYAFIKSPKHLCYCVPTEEDCSCYVKSCPINLTLSADYICTERGLQDKPNCLEIIEYNKTMDKQNRVCMENNHLCYSKTTTKLMLSDTIGAYILFSLCVIHIIVAAGMFLTVLFYEWTGKQMQRLERMFQRIQTAWTKIDVDEQAKKSVDITPDEVNFLRMVHLLFRVACPVVRMTFNLEIHPKQLQKTLYKNKLRMVKRHRKKEATIDKSQWCLLFGRRKVQEETVTAKVFDTRLMVYLLNALACIKVGDCYPVPSDKSTSAMLSIIKYISNETAENLDGKLSEDQYNQYWDDIGQAVLKLMSSCELHIENRQEKIQLIDRLLVLNPINVDNKKLCIFIYMSEIYPALLLQQLISEYCALKSFTIEKLLRHEKHQLYHKRIKTESCCICSVEIDTFNKVIPERQWKALYEMKEGNFRHCEGKQCCEHFVPKSINTWDFSVSKTLILNIPDILTHMITRLNISKFDQFLMNNQHVIYHSMKRKMCCKCSTVPTEKVVINEGEWNKLFKKDDRIPCQNGTNNCNCQFSVRNGIKFKDLDDISLSHIFYVAGPFGVFNKIEQDAFLYFINWEVDNQPLRRALNDLLSVINDKTTCHDTLSSILRPQSVETRSKQPDAHRWIARHLRQHGATTEQQLQILVPDEDGLNVKNVQIPKGFCLPLRTKKITDLTPEENNFLVVVYGLIKIVYPVIKNEFDTQCPDHVFREIRTGIFEQQTASYRRNEKHNIRNKRIHLTQVQQQRLFSQTREELKNLDFELMVYILKKRSNNKWNREYINQLNGLDKIRREIVYSSSGILDHSKFNDILTRISEAVSYFGGEIYMKELSRLRHIQNILE